MSRTKCAAAVVGRINLGDRHGLFKIDSIVHGQEGPGAASLITHAIHWNIWSPYSAPSQRHTLWPLSPPLQSILLLFSLFEASQRPPNPSLILWPLWTAEPRLCLRSCPRPIAMRGLENDERRTARRCTTIKAAVGTTHHVSTPVVIIRCTAYDQVPTIRTLSMVGTASMAQSSISGEYRTTFLIVQKSRPLSTVVQSTAVCRKRCDLTMPIILPGQDIERKQRRTTLQHIETRVV